VYCHHTITHVVADAGHDHDHDHHHDDHDDHHFEPDRGPDDVPDDVANSIANPIGLQCREVSSSGLDGMRGLPRRALPQSDQPEPKQLPAVPVGPVLLAGSHLVQ
jgi:hypothetical protein